MGAEFMAAPEVAATLGISLRSAQALFASGRIDGAVKVRRRWMVPTHRFRAQFGLEVGHGDVHAADLLG